MRQLGKALRVYMTDWEDHYPTNRAFTTGLTQGPVTEQVILSQQGVDGDGNPYRFEHGINWVEALYPYIEAISKDGDSGWRCPAASKKTYPTGSQSASVTYVMNRNLAEQTEGIIKGAGNLMLLREMDRLVNAELRPCNVSIGSATKPPMSPFLTDSDCRIGPTKAKLHMDGSNIVMADGHVKYFSAASFFPSDAQIAASGWDPQFKQWYNFADAKAQAGVVRSIAITP